MLVMAFRGLAEFEDLEPGDRAKVVTTIKFLGSQDYISMPTPMAPAAVVMMVTTTLWMVVRYQIGRRCSRSRSAAAPES